MKKIIFNIFVFMIILLLGTSFSGAVIMVDYGDQEPAQLATNEATHGPEEIESGTFTSWMKIEPSETFSDHAFEVVYDKDNYAAIRGKNDNALGYGILGRSFYGDGVYGTTASGNAVHGEAGSGNGVNGYSVSGTGVYGEAYSGGFGVYGKVDTNDGDNNDDCGVRGSSSTGKHGYLGCKSHGIYTNQDVYVGETIEIHGMLDVEMAICVDGGGAGACNIQDVAETFKTEEEPGTVVSLSGNGFKEVTASSEAYDTKVAGIISTKPVLIMGEKNEFMQPVALNGVVPTKVSDENGAIEVGDLLTTSGTPGHAMKCDDKLKCFGALVGKAMSPLDKGTGEIMVLVMLG